MVSARPLSPEPRRTPLTSSSMARAWPSGLRHLHPRGSGARPFQSRSHPPGSAPRGRNLPPAGTEGGHEPVPGCAKRACPPVQQPARAGCPKGGAKAAGFPGPRLGCAPRDAVHSATCPFEKPAGDAGRCPACSAGAGLWRETPRRKCLPSRSPSARPRKK